jgi:hypothetical protein
LSYRNEWMLTPGSASLMDPYGELGALPAWLPSDKVSSAQFVKWTKEMHAKGFSDGAVQSVVDAWRQGKLAWGAIWHPEQHGGPLSAATTAPAITGAPIQAGMFSGSNLMLLGVAAAAFFLFRRRGR